jgi:uncharacterized protein YjbJ (UPF0337 family)
VNFRKATVIPPPLTSSGTARAVLERVTGACAKGMRAILAADWSRDIDLGDVQMNWEQIEGNWKQFAGGVKEQWGKLTDDELTRIAGKRDKLAGLIQEKYGLAKEAVEDEISDFERRLDEKDDLDEISSRRGTH